MARHANRDPRSGPADTGSTFRQLGDTLLAVATDDGKPLADTVKKLPSTLDALTPALSELGAAATALGPALHDLGPSAAYAWLAGNAEHFTLCSGTAGSRGTRSCH